MIALPGKSNLTSEAVEKGEWKDREMRGSEPWGKIVGIIGLGRICSGLAKTAQVFGMKIIACDPYASRETASDVGTIRDYWKNSLPKL
jgi:D-3-phosphoglycerate dehydrogenase